MHPLEHMIERQEVAILDGALATELERRGADLKDPLWSAKILLTEPDLIRAVHHSYFLAGADLATTASYQASYEGFVQPGLSTDEIDRIFRRSVELAKDARQEFWRHPGHRQSRLYPLIAASIGPYGAYLADGSEYRGQYGLSVDQLKDWHRRRMEVLLEANPDLLALETIPCLEEAEALIELLAEFPDARAWISFSCCDEEHLCQGDSFAEAVALAETAQQVLAVGVNCTPPEYIAPLLRIARKHSSKYLLAYPNSGEVWDANQHCWLDSGEPFEFAGGAREWYEAGARLIGGCCRTSPKHIQQMRKALVLSRET